MGLDFLRNDARPYRAPVGGVLCCGRACGGLRGYSSTTYCCPSSGRDSDAGTDSDICASADSGSDIYTGADGNSYRGAE